jgi:GMP synthase PP-ATPase subunit
MNSAEKTQKLKEIIASKGSMLVSFSGGADSALLAVIAKDVLGNREQQLQKHDKLQKNAAFSWRSFLYMFLTMNVFQKILLSAVTGAGKNRPKC